MAAIILAAALLLPLVSSAVTWQMDSSPFSFSANAVKYDKRMGASQIGLWCKPDAKKGIVTISYNLPAAAKGAKLTVYTILGGALETFALQPGNASIQWNIAKKNIVTGVYIAALRYGNIEKKAQLSIVK